MLRNGVLGVGVVLMLVGAALLLLARPGTVGIAPLAMGAAFVGGVLLERYRYRAIADAPPTEPGWEMMAERFVDPGTDELMIVWYNRRTGKRLYVRAGHA